MSNGDEQRIITTFGKVIKKKREELGITQEQLAFSIDSHFTHISRLENGHKQPTLTMIFKLAGELNIEPDSLILEVKRLI